MKLGWVWVLLGCLAAFTGCQQSKPLEIRMTCDDHYWFFRYPGEDGILDTADDRLGRRDLHIPVSTAVIIWLDSTDYIYTIDVPTLEVVGMAVPEMDFSVELDVDEIGQHAIIGGQMCGLPPQGDLDSRLIIEDAQSFDQYLDSLIGLEAGPGS